MNEAKPTRVIDGKFVIRDGQIVKASSGEVVPEDEPLLLMRGRDRLAVATLLHYRRLCQIDGCNDFQLRLIDAAIQKFRDYASDPSRMKQPGITRGAPWVPPEESVPVAATTEPIAPRVFERAMLIVHDYMESIEEPDEEDEWDGSMNFFVLSHSDDGERIAAEVNRIAQGQSMVARYVNEKHFIRVERPAAEATETER